MEPFVYNKETNLLYLTAWEHQNHKLTAGFTSRNGGVSQQSFQSLNLGLHVGDDANHVIANRQSVVQSLGWDFESWTCAEQVHGSKVVKVSSTERGRGRYSVEDTIQGADAIITNEKDVLLVSFYADCVPLYFYDPIHEAIGLAHAGWKGTVANIATETLSAMQTHYGTDPGQVKAAIGPSIGMCCYEVDERVIQSVHALTERLNLQFIDPNSFFLQKDNRKFDIDLKEINRQIMIKAGILPIHIEMSNWCTGCNRHIFFSHRMENGKTGRMASWIGISER